MCEEERTELYHNQSCVARNIERPENISVYVDLFIWE